MDHLPPRPYRPSVWPRSSPEETSQPSSVTFWGILKHEQTNLHRPLTLNLKKFSSCTNLFVTIVNANKIENLVLKINKFATWRRFYERSSVVICIISGPQYTYTVVHVDLDLLGLLLHRLRGFTVYSSFIIKALYNESLLNYDFNYVKINVCGLG